MLQITDVPQIEQLLCDLLEGTVIVAFEYAAGFRLRLERGVTSGSLRGKTLPMALVLTVQQYRIPVAESEAILAIPGSDMRFLYDQDRLYKISWAVDTTSTFLPRVSWVIVEE